MALVANSTSLRPMILDDLPRVMEIERRSFPSVWSMNLYRRELEENSMARYLVAELTGEAAPPAEPPPGRQSSGWREQLRRWLASEPPLTLSDAPLIAGFVGVWFMAGDAHIVTIAVDPVYRRRGIGELLLLATADLALAHGQDVMSLECRISNHEAQALYEKYGFYRTGLRPRYYSDNREDALIMSTESLASLPYQARLAELRRRHEERWGRHERAPDLLR